MLKMATVRSLFLRKTAMGATPTSRFYHFQVNKSEYTPDAYEAVLGAKDVAIQHQKLYIENECLMLSMLNQKNGLATRVLDELVVDHEYIRLMTLDFLQKQKKESVILKFWQDALDGSIATALKDLLTQKVNPKSNLDKLLLDSKLMMVTTNEPLVGVEHLLMAYSNEERFGKSMFDDLRVTERCIWYAAQRILNKEK